MNKGKIGVRLRKFQIDAETVWPPFKVETLWVEVVEGQRVRLLNVPLYAHGLAYLDELVLFQPLGEQVVADVIEKIAKRSGHKTVRAILIDDSYQAIAEAAMDKIEELGCSWESAGETIAIDVPPGVEVEAVMKSLHEAAELGAILIDPGYLGTDVVIE